MSDARKPLSILLIAVVCLFAVAIYTPLHKHQNGRCSLNNVESYQPEQIAAAVPVPQPAPSGILEAALQVVATPTLALTALPARAPPSATA